MRYTEPANQANRPQLLQIEREGQLYRARIQHATLEEPREQRMHAGPGHVHPAYHILLFTRGVTRFYAPDGRRLARAGTLMLTGPGERHDFTPLDPGGCAYREVTFVLDSDAGPLREPFHHMLGRVLGVLLDPVAVPRHLNQGCAERLAERFVALLEALTGPGTCALYAGHVELAGMLRFLAEEVYATPERGRDADGPLERAHRILREQYATRITLADLAAEANLSPEHFARRFRKRYGASPIAYQHSLRIQAARVLLSSSDLLCKEIAARVGFSDIYAFSKAFRKATGLAPTAYREQAHPDV